MTEEDTKQAAFETNNEDALGPKTTSTEGDNDLWVINHGNAIMTIRLTDSAWRLRAISGFLTGDRIYKNHLKPEADRLQKKWEEKQDLVKLANKYANAFVYIMNNDGCDLTVYSTEQALCEIENDISEYSNAKHVGKAIDYLMELLYDMRNQGYTADYINTKYSVDDSLHHYLNNIDVYNKIESHKLVEDLTESSRTQNLTLLEVLCDIIIEINKKKKENK